MCLPVVYAMAMIAATVVWMSVARAMVTMTASLIFRTEDNEINMPDFGWDVDPCFEYYEEVL